MEAVLEKERKGKERNSLFKCLVFQRWSTNWGHCKMKINKLTQIKSNVGFEESGKPEYPERNFSVQRREPTNETHI